MHFSLGLARGMAASAALAFLPVLSVAAPPDLDAGIWTITGVDVSGIGWSGSTITFESQVAQGADYQVSGYFYWIGTGGQHGRENFQGTLFASNHITLHGYQLVAPTSGIITNVTYNADVTADGTHMINGTWGGNGIPSNAWTAVQAVPEPGQWALFLAGLAFFAMRARGLKRG